ncbi:MAG TPA: hypothetical protein VJN64_07635 [Terriglobales bacterium]|nr:hypothetical protein [Terriglobales bacterium]
MFRRAFFFSAVAFFSCSSCFAQQQPGSAQPAPGEPGVVVLNPAPLPPVQNLPQFTPELKSSQLDNRPKLSSHTRMRLIQLLDAEFVHIRKFLPLGEKDLVIMPDGQVKPGDAQLYLAMQGSGVAAKVGDKVQITDIKFHEKSITFEINGGPKKKEKWYQHISIGMSGGTAAPADSSQSRPTGASMTLEFDKHVPEMTGDELKKLISPVLDFSVKSAAQVYAETLPPKIRNAIKNHEVLVGMNHDMVVMAKDRPPQKIREKDETGKEYEEWIYGTPPQDVVFVRFIGDEVTQVKIAKVGGDIIVKKTKEVDVKDGVPTLASLKSSDSPQDVKQAGPAPEQPTHRPTLKREGEQGDVSSRQTDANTPTHQPEPEWGEKKPDDTQPAPPAAPPPQPPM